MTTHGRYRLSDSARAERDERIAAARACLLAGDSTGYVDAICEAIAIMRQYIAPHHTPAPIDANNRYHCQVCGRYATADLPVCLACLQTRGETAIRRSEFVGTIDTPSTPRGSLWPTGHPRPAKNARAGIDH